MAASICNMLKTTAVREFQQMSRKSKISTVLLLNSFSGVTIGSTYGIWTFNTKKVNSYDSSDMLQWGFIGGLLGLPVILPITADSFSRDRLRDQDEIRKLKYEMRDLIKKLEK